MARLSSLGAAHFMVSDDEARQIMRELLTLVSALS